MSTQYKEDNVKQGLVLDGLKVAGDVVGVKASKPKIKREVENSVSIVNQLMDVLLTKRGNSHKREIELAGLGVLAAYNIYIGISKKKKTSLVKGIFLSATLAGALATHFTVNKKIPNLNSARIK